MLDRLPLPDDKKLMVKVLVEPGCLGPDGIDHIEGFCAQAQVQVEKIDADFVHWQLAPRHDKSSAEMIYQVNHKTLNHDQAALYLKVFAKQLDEFEEHLHDKLMHLIDKYLGRH